MKRAGIAAVILTILSGFGLFVAVPVVKPPTPTPGVKPVVVAPPGGPAADATNRELMSLLNAERAKAKLPQLRFDERLAHAALTQAIDDARRDDAIMLASGTTLAVVMHAGSDGSTVGDRVKRQGYAWASCGEIALYSMPGPPWPGDGQPTSNQSAATAVARWMDSPAHRANILGHYEHTGGASFDAPSGTRYWVVVFGRQQ
jgi:uncharacterized protein YkwD